jgi:hypothetical protein
MTEFFATPVAADRVRIEATIGHETYRHELPVELLEDEVFRFERHVGVGVTAERMSLLRGTDEGSQFAMDSVERSAAKGEGRGVITGVLWGLAHSPQSPGWSGLDNLGGRIVRAHAVKHRGWLIQIAAPADGEQ